MRRQGRTCRQHLGAKAHSQHPDARVLLHHPAQPGLQLPYPLPLCRVCKGRQEDRCARTKRWKGAGKV